MPFFDTLELLPDDPLFSIPTLYAADKRHEKIDLSLGVYHDDIGRLPILKCIRQAEDLLHEKHADKKYLPIDGHHEFIHQTLHLIFGDKIPLDTVYGAQTVGGTSALRIAGELLLRAGNRDIYLPDSTWPNHKMVFSYAGLNVLTYPYYNAKEQSLEFEKMCAAIKTIPEGSAILLHTCCHNPTGVDPTYEQWAELSKLILKQKLLVLFDCAYQGFAVDLDTDVSPIRLFQAQGNDVLVAYSFSKNLGLYGERVGLLALAPAHQRSLPSVRSQVKQIIRSSYSNPPLEGARLALAVLESPELKELWIKELASMQNRVEFVRKALSEGLYEATGQDFSFLTGQKGLFSFLGLTAIQVKQLREQFAIYMPANGRINLAGLNLNTIDYVIEAICAILSS